MFVKGASDEYSRLIEEKDAHVTKSERDIRENEAEILKLREKLDR